MRQMVAKYLGLDAMVTGWTITGCDLELVGAEDERFAQRSPLSLALAAQAMRGDMKQTLQSIHAPREDDTV